MKITEVHISSNDANEISSTTSFMTTSTSPPFVLASEVKEDAFPTSHPEPVLLSTLDKCTVSADTPGKAGSPEIILTNGDDWNKDHWFVHGEFDWNTKLECAVPHWVQLDWNEPVLIRRVVLGWGTAYSENYDLEIRPSTGHPWKSVIQSRDPTLRCDVVNGARVLYIRICVATTNTT